LSTTTEISRQQNSETFQKIRETARSGGEMAGIARKEAEKRTSKSVITSKNVSDFSELVVNNN